jgi:hypothetical protein
MKKIQKDSTSVVVTKFVTKAIVGTSVSGTLVTMIHQNTQYFNTTQKVKLYIGAAAMGMVVTDYVKDYADKKIDELIDLYNSFAELTTSKA